MILSVRFLTKTVYLMFQPLLCLFLYRMLQLFDFLPFWMTIKIICRTLFYIRPYYKQKDFRYFLLLLNFNCFNFYFYCFSSTLSLWGFCSKFAILKGKQKFWIFSEKKRVSFVLGEYLGKYNKLWNRLFVITIIIRHLSENNFCRFSRRVKSL